MSEDLVSHLNFIDGTFTPAMSGKWLLKPDPRDSSDQCRLPDSDLMDIVRAVQASNKALANWSKMPAPERAEILLNAATLLEERADDFAEAAFADLGTNVDATMKESVPTAVDHFRAHAWSVSKSDFASLNPIGIVAVITPASDPIACLASRLAPALVHGNAVIAKISRYTPAVGVRFAQALKDAGLPDGVFNLLQGRGEEVGELLVRHPAVSTISFMGSLEKGRAVAMTAADAFKKVHYSLGAKNPVLVFANCDLNSVIPKVAKLCLGSHPSQAFKGARLFIQESVFKNALDLLKSEIESAPAIPLAKPSQVTRYKEAVSLAGKENGRSLTGNSEQITRGQFVPASLFADLTNCSTLQQEEIAGPLVLASSFKYQHEALKYANVSPFGRLGYIFENEEEKALRVAQKLETGSVFINTNEVKFDPLEEIPLLKGSGFSPEGGLALAKFFTRSSKIFASQK